MLFMYEYEIEAQIIMTTNMSWIRSKRWRLMFDDT